MENYYETIKNHEVVTKELIEKLDSFRHLATSSGIPVMYQERELTTGILFTDFEFSHIEEHFFLEILGIDYELNKNNILQFVEDLESNILNMDDINLKFKNQIEQFFNGKIQRFRIKNILYKHDDVIVYLDMNFNVLEKNKLVVFVEDVSDYVNDKFLLEELAKHNDVLIKEVHHRVKNNLQILLSLISLQERFIESNNEISDYLKLSISSMALIHNQLYAGNLNFISLNDLLDEFKANLNNLYCDLNIKFIFESNKDMQLTINKSNPLFLILNELIINTIKYTNYNDSNEEIVISIKFDIHDEYFIIIYHDNSSIVKRNMEKNKGIGSMLIQSLVGQIDGTYETYEYDTGYTMEIIAPI